MLRMFLTKRMLAGFGVMIAALVVISTLGVLAARELIDDGRALSSGHLAQNSLSDLQAQLREAHLVRRQYAQSGSADHLESYQQAKSVLANRLDEVESFTRTMPALRSQLPAVRELAVASLAPAAARETEIRALAAASALRRAASQSVDAGYAQVERGLKQAFTLGGLALTASFALLFTLVFFFNREMLRRSELEREMQGVNADLTATVHELQQLSREKSQLAAMADLLQSCRTADEAYTVISRALTRLLPGSSGAIAAVKTNASLAEVVLNWGSGAPTQAVFAPDDCWALRRGRAHAEYDASCDVRCSHILPDARGASLCLPLIAQGEALGVLYLNLPDGDVLSTEIADLTLTLSEQISMALANLRLQEMLRMQSIIDPLSGVYNRRYMESTLERELLRAKRSAGSLALIMIDLDHFKQFNDRFGHDAGDTLLRAFGGLLKSVVRGDDVACRYGGEEFVLIMPGAPEAIAVERADQVRRAMRELTVQHLGRELGRATLSLGVAVFPAHGLTGAELMQAADAALYRAKHGGRDRVAVANTLRLAAVAG